MPFAAKILRMAGMEKGQVKRKSGQTGTGEEAETKAIQNWLRSMDKPLTKEKPDREDPEARGQ